MSNIIYKLDQLQEASDFLTRAAGNRVLCFHGDLGAGKTTLIKAVLRNLGGADAGNSPTFGLVNEYRDREGNLLAYHLDCYRIEDAEEALDLGIEEYLDADCWVFVEWPDRIHSLLPGTRTDVYLSTVDPTTRNLFLRNRSM